jgi:hypothetical protein
MLKLTADRYDGLVRVMLIEGDDDTTAEVIDIVTTDESPIAITILMHALEERHADLDLAYVRNAEGEWEQTDCITVGEALECTL